MNIEPAFAHFMKHFLSVWVLASLSSLAISDPIKIVMPEEFKPYTYLEDGLWTGIDLEINQELFIRKGSR